MKQVGEMSTVVVGIAGSSNEQATGLTEVNTAIAQMDQLTQRNAAMVEETTAASHSLSSEAKVLAELVGQFKIGRDASSSRRANKPASGRPLQRAAAAAPARTAYAVAPASARRMVANGAPVEASDDWEEF
jgi:methyl-accepting chemotaxis protein